MKTISLLATLMLGSALAQSVSINIQLPKVTWPAGQGAAVTIQLPPGRPALKNVFPANYDAAEACAKVEFDADGDLTVNWPARFPNAARMEFFGRDYRLNCPTFTVERIDGKTLTVRGLSLPQFAALMKADYRNQPYMMRAGDTVLEVGEGYVLHPITWQEEAPREDLVIVARQSGADPVVLAFNGADQSMVFDPAKPVEVFWKASFTLPWGRMVYEHDKRVIHFDVEAPFPYK